MTKYAPLFFAVEFKEYSIVENSGRSEYDITAENLYKIKNEQDFKYDYEAYCLIMLQSLSQFNKYQRKEFIIHHLGLVQNKKDWFFKMQDCLDIAMTETNMFDRINLWPNWLSGMSEIMDQIYSEIKEELLRYKAPEHNIDPEKTDFRVVQNDFRDKKKDILPYSVIIKTPSRFARFEESLHHNGYIDTKLNYIHNHGAKNELACIYLHLINKNYFNKKQFPQNIEIKEVAIRKFLDHRYQTDIDKQFRTYRKNPNAVAEFVDSRFWLDQIPSC